MALNSFKIVKDENGEKINYVDCEQLSRLNGVEHHFFTTKWC